MSRIRPTLAWLAALMIFLLAGCIGGNDSPQGNSRSPGPSGSETDPGTTDPTDPGGTADPTDPTGTDPTGPVNAAPSAELNASAVSGTAPLPVTFTVNGSDPDGDALTWSLDSNGDGTVDATGEELPATVNVTFDSPGSFNVTLTVSDGVADDVVMVSISVEPAGPVARQQESGEFLLAYPGDECNAGHYDPDLEGITYYSFAVDPDTYGLPFHAAFEATETLEIVGVDFIDANGDYIETFNDGGSMVVDGIVTEGAVKAAFWGCVGAQVSGTYLAGGELVTG